MKPIFISSLLVSLAPVCRAADLQITAANKLQLARPAETIELGAADLKELGAGNLDEIHIKDSAGKELVCQAIDLDGDALHKFDALLFQADFAPGETKTFTASAGKKQIHQRERYQAFGRFVRERFDDFAWENDRIAHRTYGKALETWEGEPLASSTIDIWSKRSPRMLINDWYMTDDYHSDHGEGADFYSAGATRGCGGSGLWADGKLWVSRNFIDSRVLANGPIRVLFELDYEPYDVNGASVRETKRISLDAGSQFDRFENHYHAYTRPGVKMNLTAAIGLRKVAGAKLETNPAEGWIEKWEPMEKNAGQQGLAAIVDPGIYKEAVEGPLDNLLLADAGADGAIIYHAGFCWDKAGRFTTAEGWKTHVSEVGQALRSPIEVKVSAASGEAANEYFMNWPDGAAPAVVGERIAENIAARKFHYESDPSNPDIQVIYPEVIAEYGGLTLAGLTGDKKLEDKLVTRFERFLEPPAADRVSRKAHVDFRVFGAAPLEIYLQNGDERFKKLGLELADAQWEKTTPDGITAEARYWIDDMYMIPIVQAQAFRATGDRKYLDRAALAMEAYFDKLQQPNGLFYHGSDSPFFWGRGNGWMAAGSAELLRSLPENHPRRARILKGYRTMMAALLANQAEDGMWRQLIDQADSWPESSGSAMFAFAMVTGVKNGWLETETYAPAARKAWLALISRLDGKGNLRDVCVGTNKGFTKQYYMDRPRNVGDLHGEAPMLWTASALLR